MPLTGRRVSHYAIGEELSRGGMGVVYRATDSRLGRDVAFKVLSPDIASNPDARLRFLREARAASHLEHPNIAVIYDVGDEDGLNFIAMELLPGRSLAALIEQSPVSPERALDLAIEIGEALAHAHAQGVVHRDLKPANVLLTRTGHAKVIDFGLAKRIEQAQDEATMMATAPGVVLGTTAYMSPEQARGALVDTRSDIFSFGVLLYELVAGVRPFRGQSSLEILDSVLHTPAPALPIPGLAADSPASQEINRLVGKCLEKDAAARYQGMADVLVDLRAVRGRLGAPASGISPASATPHGPAPSTGAAAGRRWLVPVAIAATLLVAVGAFWLWTRRSADTNVSVQGDRRSLAVLYFENNTGSAELDWLRTGLTDMLVTDLSQTPDVEVLSTDRLAQIMRDLGRGDERVVNAELVQEVARRAGVQTVLLGSYVKAGGVIRINLKLQEAQTGRILNADRADAQSEAALFPTIDELTRRLKDWIVQPVAASQILTRPGTAPSSTPQAIDAALKDVTTSSVDAFRLFAEGNDLHVRLREEDALPLMQKAVAIDPDFALAYAKMAVITGNLGRTSERDSYIKRALEHLDRLSEPERLYIQAYASSFGPETAPKGMEIYEQLLAKYPGHGPARNNLASIYLIFERYDDATRHYRVLHDAGYEFPGAIDGLAYAYSSMGRSDDALKAYDEYIVRYPAEPRGYAGKGEILLLAGRLDEARAAYDRALSLRPGLTPALYGLVTISLLREQWDDAVERARAMQASNSPNTARWGFKMEGLIALHRGRSSDALRLLERGALLEGGAGGNGDSASTRAWMAEALIAGKRYAEAIAMADRGIADAHGNPSRFPNMMAKAVAAASLGRAVVAADIVATFDALAARIKAARLSRMSNLVRGRVAVAAGDREGALAALTAAEATSPPGGTPTLLWSVPEFQPLIWHGLGRLHEEAGRLDQARAYFEKVARSGALHILTPVEYAESLHSLARIAERQDDPATARDYDGRFLALWGDGDLMRDEVSRARRPTGRD